MFMNFKQTLQQYKAKSKYQLTEKYDRLII